MKIVICVNHSWPHIGGSEKVVQQISESLTNCYGHEVVVLSRSISKNTNHNNVKYIPCPSSDDGFLSKLKNLKPNHTHVYSDCFTYWGSLLHECENIQGTKSIALVGMNHMRECVRVMKVFLRKKDQFRVITHSDSYVDYQKCQTKGIEPVVIPNGVDLNEFDCNQVSFKTKGKKTVLCVSNFFPGKGQGHLVRVLNLLYNRRSDFRAVFMYTSTNFAFGRILERQTKRLLEKVKFEYSCLKDKPREKVVSAFNHADVFAFPSQKEVAPLVILESQAAKTPWVALPVGNVRDLHGGIVVPHSGVDANGYARYSTDVYKQMADALDQLLDENQAKLFIRKGRKQIEDKYSWDKISGMYNEVFIS